MKVLQWGALGGTLVLAGLAAPGTVVQAQTHASSVRSLEILGPGGYIGVTVRDVDTDGKDAKTGVVVEEVTTGSPADKAGIKAGDTVTEFDGERVRGRQQFTRLVRETPDGRSVQAVLSRSGQRVTVTVTPERSAFGSDYNLRRLDTPMARMLTPTPAPPPPPAAPRAPRPPSVVTPALPFQLFDRLGRGRLGITVEDLDTQLGEYFGVKEGVLVKSVAVDSAAAKAGLKAGDVITAVNGRHVYDSSDVTRAIDRNESNGDFTIDVTRDKKTLTLKGKLEAPDSRVRTRVRTNV